MPRSRLDDRPRREPTGDASAASAELNRAHGVPVCLVVQRAELRNEASDQRLRAALKAHYQLVWRTLRRLGVDPGAVDDAAQHVFLTLAAHLASTVVVNDRAFLIGTCARVAANARRRRVRSRETADDCDHADLDGLSPEELLHWKQRRQLLDRALDALAMEQRPVFVLHELEGFTLPEIAEALSVPLGTATSRLRRARLAFECWVAAHQRSDEEIQ